MHFSTLLGLAAGLATAHAATVGFNYGNMMSDGTPKDTSTYEAEFKRAQSLQGTNGEFTSARIYTMIQGGTTDTVTAAIQAAINTKTSLLLGMWASSDQATFDNEISALKAAISQYGSSLDSLVVGLSVGSEDLYRISPTGIMNQAGIGQSPEVLVDYIKQTRQAVAGTSLSDIKIGHVDTWTAWVNSSNFDVTDNCDWLGVDSYPYFETTVQNSIANGNSTFWDSYDQTVSASKGKEVWVTETGWPVSGDVSGEAVASIANAETYWQEVACTLLNGYNVWWYTLQDATPTVPDPSFGIVGSNLNSAPLYDLTCKKSSSTSDPSSDTKHHLQNAHHPIVAGPNGTSSGNGTHSVSPIHGTRTSGPHATGMGSGSASGSASGVAASATVSNTNDAPRSGAAAGAGILAIFGLVAAL